MMQLAEKLQNAADRQRFSGIINLAQPLKIMCCDRGNTQIHTQIHTHMNTYIHTYATYAVHMQKGDPVSKVQS